MSILTSNEILRATQSGKIDIRPFRTSQLNPNSYNLTLGKTLLTYDTTHALDLQSEPKTFEIEIPPEGYVLQPNILYLGHTNEVTYTKSYAPFIEGRSSIGRMGISVHITAGFGDIGFNGTWTLEITVVHPVRVYADVEICQIAFHTVEGDAVVRYVGKYKSRQTCINNYIVKFFK
jgi:dCTP deaminase